MQDWWENREYVVEKWPYPNVMVYVVCPRDGEGHSQTLHRNYLLLISPNLEQRELDKPVARVGNDTSPTPAPSVSDAPVEAEPSGMVTPSSTGSTPEIVQIDLLPFNVAVGPLGTNFSKAPRHGQVDDAGPIGIWDAWVGLCISLYILFCLCTVLWKGYSVTHTLSITTNVC